MLAATQTHSQTAPQTSPASTNACLKGPRIGLDKQTRVYRLYGARGLIGCGTARELSAATGYSERTIARSASHSSEMGPWGVSLGPIGGPASRCARCAACRGGLEALIA